MVIITVQRIRNHHIQYLKKKKIFFSQLLSHVYFRPWLNFFLSHRTYYQNFIQIDNVQQCQFQF